MLPSRITTVETRLPSACILAIPMLCVRPSCRSVKFCSVSNDAECVSEALAQGRLFCKVGFCGSALCALQMCLTWCVDLSRPHKAVAIKMYHVFGKIHDPNFCLPCNVCRMFFKFCEVGKC